MQETIIPIQGMTCGGCVNSVTRVLKALPGVESVEVQLNPGQAAVKIDESRVDISTLKKAIVEAGYTTT